MRPQATSVGFHHGVLPAISLLASLAAASAGPGCRGRSEAGSGAASRDAAVEPEPGWAAAPTGVVVPAADRSWTVIAPSFRADKNEVRMILGNASAVEALRSGSLPLPDGAVLAKLAWASVPSPKFEGAFVPGDPARIEFMIKDAARRPDTGGWGFGRWIAGGPADAEQHATCFPCHEASVQRHDFLFTRWVP